MKMRAKEPLRGALAQPPAPTAAGVKRRVHILIPTFSLAILRIPAHHLDVPGLLYMAQHSGTTFQLPAIGSRDASA